MDFEQVNAGCAGSGNERVTICYMAIVGDTTIFFLSNTNFLESAIFKPCNIIIQQIESKFVKSRKPATPL